MILDEQWLGFQVCCVRFRTQQPRIKKSASSVPLDSAQPGEWITRQQIFICWRHWGTECFVCHSGPKFSMDMSGVSILFRKVVQRRLLKWFWMNSGWVSRFAVSDSALNGFRFQFHSIGFGIAFRLEHDDDLSFRRKTRFGSFQAKGSSTMKSSSHIDKQSFHCCACFPNIGRQNSRPLDNTKRH